MVTYVRHRRARHYLLRLDADGNVRITVPWRGSREEANRFIREKISWIERERFRQSLRQPGRRWEAGTPVLLDGEEVGLAVIENAGQRTVSVGPHRVPLSDGDPVDLKPVVERHLQRVATVMLDARLRELAAELRVTVVAVTVRGQRSRWGSCSPSGRISLNWRLIQLPPTVRDYVLLHELTHLRHPNHSRRFWRALEQVCPNLADARAWLRGASLQTM